MLSCQANSTAKLAAAFGLLLLMAESDGRMAATLDPRTARELSVLSRILEKRLADTRKVLADVVTPEACNAPNQ